MNDSGKFPDIGDAICQIYHAWQVAMLITELLHEIVQKILNTLLLS